MNNLQFIKKLYNGRNCYSDSLTEGEIEQLHIPSGVETIVARMVKENRIIFLTGNPGDGKTYIIRAIEQTLKEKNVYVEKDLNSVTDVEIEKVISNILGCYHNNKSCIIAANEFPFFKLIRASRVLAPELHKELTAIKKNTIIYGHSAIELKRICIIDLNERSLLDKDRSIITPIIEKFVHLLKDSQGINHALDYNTSAFQNEHVVEQLKKLFSLVAMSGSHFAIRDILGALSYTITSCTNDDEDNMGYYYDALFSGDNDLMSFILSFDPVMLTVPSLDEQLWNGEAVEGWLMGLPTQWPYELTENSIEEANKLFKSIKRRYYFENIYAKSLSSLQPMDYLECERIFTKLTQSSEKRMILRMLIHSMNRLFLSSDEEREYLRIWTTHSYDQSRAAGAAVSTRYIDTTELELLYPSPASWLMDMEYSPNCLLMRLKNKPDVKLEIDTTLLRGLICVKNGYPASLLSSQYELAIAQFTQQLSSTSYAKNYGDGKILLANRRDGSQKSVFIEDNKYRFDDRGEY